MEGESSSCVQIILSDEQFECQYYPDHNQLFIMKSPSSYTRERLYLFEHERSYRYIENGFKIEEKDEDYYVYINMDGQPSFLMKYKKGYYDFPYGITRRTSREISYISYSNDTKIDGLRFPSQIRFEQHDWNEEKNEYMKSVISIYKFTNIKIDHSIERKSIDFLVPPKTLIVDHRTGKTSQLNISDEPISARNLIQK